MGAPTPPRLALRGAITALVTPLAADGAIDWHALDAHIDRQLAAGIGGLVACGSTGEAACLSESERDAVLSRVVARAGGAVPVLAGTGAAATAATIAAQRRARDLGADAGLVVTPPYVRPSALGLVAHYRAVAGGDPLPVVAYNVPTRTGCDLQVADVAALAGVPGLVGLKDASADLARLAPLRAAVPDWALLSGDDATACAFSLAGGHGTVSVLSNLVPAAVVRLHALIEAGDLAGARAQGAGLAPLCAALGQAGNPVGIKEAMAAANLIGAHVRLPLVPLDGPVRQRMRAAVAAAMAKIPP